MISSWAASALKKPLWFSFTHPPEKITRAAAAQPIVTVGYHRGIPPLQTGVPGLVLANTTQIYPEDRGTNYAVRLGTDAAAALLSNV